MTRALFLGAASALMFAAPAFAQHAGHAAPSAQPETPAPAADPTCPPEHAAMGHCTPSTGAKPAGSDSTPATNPHAGHAMPTQASPVDPACPPEHAAMGHCTPGTPSSPADQHAGHAMPGMESTAAPPVAPPPPEAFKGPENAAETVFNPELFRRKRKEELIDEHGAMTTAKVLIDQLEYRAVNGRDGYKWDAEGWYGGDYDKLWLKTEGEGAFGEAPEQAEVQALYSRALDPWFNLQLGVRHDFRPAPERTHLVVGIEGLAPYWFELDGALFLSDKGDLTARLEAEYEQRITRKLILQPAVEFNLSAQNAPKIGLGSGLTSAEAGLRLRYEFVAEVAPDIGVEYERKFGDTADFARRAGERVGGWSFLVGLRSWF